MITQDEKDAQERENLIEGDPVGVVDELLKLRKLADRLEDLRDLNLFKLISVRGALARNPEMDSVRKLTLELVEQHYESNVDALEQVING